MPTPAAPRHRRKHAALALAGVALAASVALAWHDLPLLSRGRDGLVAAGWLAPPPAPPPPPFRVDYGR
ncbi:hypothetical protein IP88_13040, partial [alpha proteobacterium AAP81b]